MGVGGGNSPSLRAVPEHQKDANLILTRKCFTIAIKTIQLSSDIIKHDEFIKATFSSEQFLKQTIYLLLEAKTPSISLRA